MTTEPLVLDQPWQIEMYRLHVIKHFCALRALGLTNKSRRSLASLRLEFDLFTATRWADAEADMIKVIEAREIELGIRPAPSDPPTVAGSPPA